MSFTISPATLGANFHPRETATAGGRSASGSGSAPAAAPVPFQEPVDVVQTSQSGGGNAQNDAGTFFHQTPERYGLAGNKTQYAIDLDSQEVIIKVVDPTTQKELRQIPSPEARKLAKQIEAYQSQAFDNV